MSINNLVTVNTHYTRSVNLERDASSVDVINAYIPTSRALRTFARVSDEFNTELSPRAWSLIGPYGSGKSSFSVFLSQLLSNPADEGSHAALQVLKKADELLTKKFSNETNKNERSEVDIHITHDWNMMLILYKIFNFKESKLRWPYYLEPIFIEINNSEILLTYEGEQRLLDIDFSRRYEEE